MEFNAQDKCEGTSQKVTATPSFTFEREKCQITIDRSIG